jgi:hypothetical protein
MTSRARLTLALLAIAVIWQLPYGQQLLYPFSLLASFAHEMGHGLAALLVGADFERLLLHADGSGLAQWRGNPGRLAAAWIAAGGLLGPTVAGVALLLLSRSPRQARILLAAGAAVVLLTMLLWARNPFAVGFLLLVAIALVLAALRLPDAAAAFLLHFIAALLCLSWFRDLDYMFSAHAIVGGVAQASDSARIAEALFLPYWFWGGFVAAVSLTLLIVGLLVATRSEDGTPSGHPRRPTSP